MGGAGSIRSGGGSAIGAARAPVAELRRDPRARSRPDRRRRRRSGSSARARNKRRRAGAARPRAIAATSALAPGQRGARDARAGREEGDLVALAPVLRPGALGAPRRSARARARSTASGVRLSSLAISRSSSRIRSICARSGRREVDPVIGVGIAGMGVEAAAERAAARAASAARARPRAPGASPGTPDAPDNAPRPARPPSPRPATSSRIATARAAPSLGRIA